MIGNQESQKKPPKPGLNSSHHSPKSNTYDEHEPTKTRLLGKLTKNNKFSRVIRFASVGVFNTIVDFTVFNILIFTLGFNHVLANVISVSIAVTVSYILNHSFVFKSDQKMNPKNMAKFFAITAFGIYIIQNIIIYLMSYHFDFIGILFSEVAYTLTSLSISDGFVVANFAKAIATLATMIWNYQMYKNFIFNKKNNTANSSLAKESK